MPDPLASRRALLPVHGLVQDVIVSYEEGEEGGLWRKRPRHGRVAWIPGAEEACDLLAALPATISSAAAAVATGQVGAGLVPRITLSLSPADAALLHQAHRSSDWVITIDRTLGMEYFDSPGSGRRPDYVIDFEGSTDGGLGHHLVISSRSIDELRAMLAPAIGQHGAGSGPSACRDVLRAASPAVRTTGVQARLRERRTNEPRCSGWRSPGSTWTTRHTLEDQVLVPLDDHLELYREARPTAGDRRGGEPVPHGPGAVEPGRAAAADHLQPRRGEVLQLAARGERIRAA